MSISRIVSKRNKKIIPFLLIISLLPIQVPFTYAEAEAPAEVYSGISNAREIINNIDFDDISAMPANYWAREAIYEAAALEAIKGYGDKSFRPGRVLSKEEAIALIYRMLGREGEAQKAAEALDQVRSKNQKKDQAVSMWADGYLKLAANDGLITQGDLQTALQRFQPKPGSKNRFVRADPAQRQEVAYWAAKAMKLEPVYGQQIIFNSFDDWDDSDPVKVPYIEAILKNRIMNGRTGGVFDPLGPVSREQMAQVLKNMENIVLPQQLMYKKSGYVEDIYSDRDEKLAGGTISRVIAVRGDDGKLYHIMTQTSQDQLKGTRQEFDPGRNAVFERELVVYKDRILGASEEIEVNDQLEYIVNDKAEVRFIKVRPGSMAVQEVSATVTGVDTASSTISVADSRGDVVTYRISDTAEILQNGKPITLAEINKDRQVNLRIRNKMIIRLEVSLANAGGEEGNIVGIVEDNNPALNYISLYDENGMVNDSRLRVFNYLPEAVKVEKNHKKAGIEDIVPGDTVHIILDENGNIEELSGADNYQVAYGKIVFKQPSYLIVESDDGAQQKLEVAHDVLVIFDRKIWSYDRLKDGDFIRMLLQKTPEMTKVKEITSQTYTQDISNIYKAELDNIDLPGGKITLKHPERLYKGKWKRDDQVGFTVLKTDHNLRMFDGSEKLDVQEANKLYIGRNLYAAVKKGFGNEEVVQTIRFLDPKAKEILYNDTLSSVDTDAGRVTLGKTFGLVELNQGTIVVKDGKLVTGRSLSANDTVYMAVNKNPDSEETEAGLIMTVEKPALSMVQIFRGELQKVNQNSDFTLKTFAVLNGLTWEGYGFPKTFSITFNTRMFRDEGIANVRDFAYDSDLIGKPMYVVADETEALLISNAPYGAFNVRGEVIDVGSDLTDSGESEQEGESGQTAATQIKLLNASIYNKNAGQWENKGIITLGVLTNTIIIKNGQLITPDDIEKGDFVRLLKKDNTSSGDTYLILVEN